MDQQVHINVDTDKNCGTSREVTDDEVSEDYPLDAAEARKCRAITATLNYLAADRVDI